MCNHFHSNSCRQCAEPHRPLISFVETSKQIEYENENPKDDSKYIVNEGVRAVHEWKNHVLRTVNQNDTRKDIMENLKDHKICWKEIGL